MNQRDFRSISTNINKNKNNSNSNSNININSNNNNDYKYHQHAEEHPSHFPTGTHSQANTPVHSRSRTHSYSTVTTHSTNNSTPNSNNRDRDRGRDRDSDRYNRESRDISTLTLSPVRRHRRDNSNISAISFGTIRTPRTPQGSQEYVESGPSSKYLSPVHSPQRLSARYPPVEFSSEFSPFPYYNSPERKQARHHSNLSVSSYDSPFPKSAIRSPIKSPYKSPTRSSKRKEKNVSFLELPVKSQLHSRSAVSSLKYNYLKEEEEDHHTIVPRHHPREALREWNKVSASASYDETSPHKPLYRRSPQPRPYYLPSPKGSRSKPNFNMQETNSSHDAYRSKHDRVSADLSSSAHVIASDSTGVEVVLKAKKQQQQQHQDSENGPYSLLVRSDKKPNGSDTKNDTPPREKTMFEKGKKVIVSPPEQGQGHGHGHNRSASYNTVDFHPELPSVPDSPYSPFRQYHPGYNGHQFPPSHQHQHGHQFPPSSPLKGSMKSPSRQLDDRQAQYPYLPYHGYSYAPPGFDDNYREVSPGKRQRLSPAETDSGGKYPESERHPQDPYQQRAYFNRSSGNRDFYSESFDSDQQSNGHGHDRPKHGHAPPVSKAYSYPPPPSPGYAGVPESSSSSYPGSRRSHPAAHGPSNESSYGQVPHPRGHAPPGTPGYDYHDPMYYPDGTHSPSRYHEIPGAGGPRPPPGYYYPETAQPPRDDVHPLLRDYDPERDHRPGVGDESMGTEKQYSPSRTSMKADTESVATTPSLKSRSSNKSISPSKRKPSTAAKAAIAAGMTQPQSAREVDFDIHDPPLNPIIRASNEPVCSISSNLNNNDVLCGRGGGTNTQIGNRRFRSLVQEFQPTYLLCRRKEKPLIARTIVLIIRHRGGRFLKKDEGNGMLFEVGDVKAEAKTSQALREGLDVRASKSTTLMGRKKARAADKKKKVKDDTSPQSTPKTDPIGQGDDATISESPMRAQRDGPPSQHDYPQYPPNPYFYGYGNINQYPPMYGYEQNPAFGSPSRKRQRAPQSDPMYYPPPPFNHKTFPSYQYPPEYHYQGGYPPVPPQQSQAGEENAMWEMDFNPPRGSTKKENVRLKGEQ